MKSQTNLRKLGSYIYILQDWKFTLKQMLFGHWQNMTLHKDESKENVRQELVGFCIIMERNMKI